MVQWILSNKVVYSSDGLRYRHTITLILYGRNLQVSGIQGSGKHVKSIISRYCLSPVALHMCHYWEGFIICLTSDSGNRSQP